jgi:hypothetical protein
MFPHWPERIRVWPVTILLRQKSFNTPSLNISVFRSQETAIILNIQNFTLTLPLNQGKGEKEQKLDLRL